MDNSNDLFAPLGTHAAQRPAKPADPIVAALLIGFLLAAYIEVFVP